MECGDRCLAQRWKERQSLLATTDDDSDDRNNDDDHIYLHFSPCACVFGGCFWVELLPPYLRQSRRHRLISSSSTMSTSSRWKRFAFFERKNLSLPPSVVRDLVPASTATTTKSKKGDGSAHVNDNIDDALDPKFLYRGSANDGIANGDDEEYELTSEECHEIGIGEYFSLVAASNVPLPPPPPPPTPPPSSTAVGDGRTAARAAGGRGGGDGSSPNTATNNNKDAVAKMTAGLVALQSSPSAAAASNNNIATTEEWNKLQLLFASSRNTSLVHCIDVTVRCTPANPLLKGVGGGGGGGEAYYQPRWQQQQQQQQSSGGIKDDTVSSTANVFARGGKSNINNPSSNAFATSSSSSSSSPSSSPSSTTTTTTAAAHPEELDGWRGRYDPFLSCDGFLSSTSANSNSTGGIMSTTMSKQLPATTTTTTTTMKKKMSIEEQRILDEHLSGVGRSRGGGGGNTPLFSASPFAPQQQQQQQMKKARVVGLATATTTTVYHHHHHSNSSSSAATSSSTILFVAAITDTSNTIGVVVHANPHLNLSSTLPPTSSASSTTEQTLASSSTSTSMMYNDKNNNNSWYYKPTTYNFTNHGKPTCISLLSGLVCVGTDFGIVLIYTFDPGSSNSSSNSSSSDGNSNVSGSNKRLLSLVAEIPAPQRQGDGGGGSNANTGMLTNNDDDDKGITKKKKQYKLYAVSSLHLVEPSTSSSEAGNAAGGTDGGGGNNSDKYHLFVSYRKRIIKDGGIEPSSSSSSSPSSSSGGVDSTNNTSSTASSSAGGVCCYELGGIRISSTTTTISATSAPLVGVGGTTTTTTTTTASTTTMSGWMTAQSPSSSSLTIIAPVVTARYDMDGRDVSTSCFCDGVDTANSPVDNTGNNIVNKTLPRYAVARADGLHMYSPEEKVGVCPIDGSMIAMCSLPPPPRVYLKRPVRRPISSRVGNDGTSFGSSIGEGGGVSNSPAAATTAVEDSNDGIVNGAGALYTLVATTDIKLGRDAVDIYDTTNKLVGFHVLLSPGHRALRAVGLFSCPMICSKTLLWGGRSSAVVLTSGGSIVTLTERITPEKIDLLTQKNLYPAAISMAYSDPQFYRPEDIVTLYRRYAEHLFKKGDFSAAIEQYIQTIGSLESSHVIFRFLDAPKIFLAVEYLKSLRAAGLSSSVHDQLLRTCYLKLGDVEAASKIMTSSSSPSLTSDAATTPFSINPDGSELSTVPISRNFLASADDVSEMLSAICSLYPPEAVEALVKHGVLIARSLPRETAGVVIALCEGSYSPSIMADAAAGPSVMAQSGTDDKKFKCEKYPISLFVNAFMENPKLLRLILSHCRRNDLVLTPMLKRTLLELTLDEWNVGKRMGDVHVQKLRRDEAIMLLSESSHMNDLGDCEALVIVQAALFTEGMILLYERLNMIPMLLEEYSRSGTDRARRQMLAMCENRDPEIFAEVLSHFVCMAEERLNTTIMKDETSFESESEIGGLLNDIHEALVMARDYGDVPPVRILRILAGEGHGVFHSEGDKSNAHSHGVPMSATMDYVGAILDECAVKIHRLKVRMCSFLFCCVKSGLIN